MGRRRAGLSRLARGLTDPDHPARPPRHGGGRADQDVRGGDRLQLDLDGGRGRHGPRHRRRERSRQDDVDAVRRRADAHPTPAASGSTATTHRVSSVEAARSLGVGMVHQEFSVVDDLTLAENLVLGVEPTRRGMLDLGGDRVGDVRPRGQDRLEAAVGPAGRRCRRRRSQPLRAAPPAPPGLRPVDPRRADGGPRPGRRRSAAGDDGRAAQRPARRSCSSPTSWAR